MTDPITVELVEPEAAPAGHTRADFLRRGIAGGGALLGGSVLVGGLPSLALGAPSAKQDGEILNFALLLEYLESEFYKEAVSRGALSGEVLGFARTVRDHEVAHVKFLRAALGSAAIAKPGFDFGDTTGSRDAFLATAKVLEDTGVAAYNGQGPRLTKKTLAAAAQIVSVEARHAAWVRRIVDGPRYAGGASTYPAPVAFDEALTKAQVEQAVGATGFVKG
jgi:hypothetical protein